MVGLPPSLSIILTKLVKHFLRDHFDHHGKQPSHGIPIRFPGSSKVREEMESNAVVGDTWRALRSSVQGRQYLFFVFDFLPFEHDRFHISSTVHSNRF
jgi:hypothetical protein